MSSDRSRPSFYGKTLALLIIFSLVLVFGTLAFVTYKAYWPPEGQQTQAAQTCDIQQEYREFGWAFRRIGAAKVMCGYMEPGTAQQLVVCSGSLPFPQLTPVRSCEELRSLSNGLKNWLDKTIPPAREACKSTPCIKFFNGLEPLADFL